MMNAPRSLQSASVVRAAPTSRVSRIWESETLPACALKPQCTPSVERRVTRWEHEATIEAMQRRMYLALQSMMKLRRRTAEHPLGTLKAWMGSTHFLMKRLKNVRTEISLRVLAYNLKRVIGIGPLIAALQT